MNNFKEYCRKILLFFLIIISPIIFLGVMKNNVIAYEDQYKKYIIIDPGHGGIDGGGMSNTGVYEKEINLKVSYYLKSYLKNAGYNVLMTRYNDYDLASKNSKNRKKEDITRRVEFINKENVILYISVHCNIYTDNSIRGAQTFYNSSNEENKILSKKIQDKLNNILKNTTRQSKSITDKYLLDNAHSIGCLVEIGFLSNQEEFELLNTSTYQDKVAYCIFIGIIDYLGINNNF